MPRKKKTQPNPATPEPLSPAARLLVEVLARQDALWTPFRGPWLTFRRASVVYERRMRYRRQGIDISTGGSEVERQNMSRLIRALEQEGFIVVRRRSGSGKRAAVLLSDLGDQIARSLAGLQTLKNSFTLADAIEYASTTGERIVGQQLPWVQELFFLEIDNYDAKNVNVGFLLRFLEELALPCLTRGQILAHSDGKGRMWYAPAPNAPARTQTLPAKQLPKFDLVACEIYFQALADAQEELEHAEPEIPNAIAIPLPCRPMTVNEEDQWLRTRQAKK